MKILLIFPPYSMRERYKHDVGEDIGGHLPPLGLCYIAAILEQDNHKVKILDCPTLKYTQDDVIEEIKTFKPDFVGLAAITSLIDRATEITKKIKQENKNIIVVIGGPHATQMPEETLKETGCDIVIKGEADLAFKQIVSNSSTEKKIIQGEIVKNLDDLPFPARHLLDTSKYNSLPNNYKISENVFQVMTTRGCPYKCTFCASANSKYRQRSVKNVIEELKKLKEEYNVKEIAFWDDIFTVNKKWIIDFCNSLISEKIDIAWSCEARLDLIDEEMATLMKKTGCWNIFFGIESGNQELLDNIKKRTTLDMIRKGVKITKDAGIEVRGSFILGLPGETPKKAMDTIRFAIELDPDYAQFCITTPFPGTELWDTAEQWGTLNRDFKKYDVFAPVFIPKGYKDADELQKMQKTAFRKFYFRPKYIMKRILRIKNLRDFKRHLKGFRVVLGMSDF